MDTSESPREPSTQDSEGYIPGEDVIDISFPSSSSDFRDQVNFVDTDGTSYEFVDNSNLDPLYFASNDDDQTLVSKFLYEDFNFNENKDTEGGSSNENVEGSNTGENITEGKLGEPTRTGVRNRVRKTVKKLPPALKGLMGEANLRCARGDKETAVKICLEIIREVPTNPQPYLTLAGIYDEMGDQAKYLQMSFVAAHLSPTDVFQWVHLAELSEELGNIKQAIMCYTKAINVDIQNMELHKKRAILLDKIGDKRTALKGYIRLLSALNSDQGEYIISLAKFIAEMCHKENDVVKASGALEVAIQKVPHLVNLEFINLLLECLIQLKSYRRSLEVMVSYCDLVIEGETGENDSFKVVGISLPEATPVDIVSKLIVILIHIKAFDIIADLLSRITSMDVSEVGELYLDIIEAYMEEEKHEEAGKLLSELLLNENYNLPAVWLKYADIQKILGRHEKAVEAYSKVLEQAPQHFEARTTLASILVDLKREEEAITILTQGEDECLDASLLYERCMLLQLDEKKDRDLVMVAQLLFSRNSMKIRNKDELSAISLIQRCDRKRFAIKQVRKCRKEPEFDYDVPDFRKGSKEPTSEEEWELFKYVCSVCVKLKMYSMFQRLTFTAQLSITFIPHKFELDILSVIAAYYNGDSHSGYNIIRTLVSKNPNNVKLWQLFNLVVSKSDDVRHHRFVMRQLSRNSNHPALGHLHGNNCFVSGTYKYAMHEYSTAFLRTPTDLLALLLGLTYLHMAAQKFTSKKHRLVIQSLGLLSKYKDKRGPDGLQEAHYNLGRGFQHLGLFTPAIYHYKKVLSCQKSQLASDNPQIFDLSREAAFNLHLIYRQSESYDLAKMYLEKYIVV